MDNTPIETGLQGQQGIGTGIDSGIQGSGWYQSFKQYENGPGLEQPGFLDYLGKIGSNELNSVTSNPLGYAGDLVAAPFRGAVDAAMGVYGLADWLTDDLLPDWKNNPLGNSATAVGGLVQGIANFAVGFVPVVGWMGKAGRLASASKIGMLAKAGEFLQAGSLPGEAQAAFKAAFKATGSFDEAQRLASIGKATKYISGQVVGGAITSALVFRGDQERLSNLLTQIDNPLLNNAVTQYLSADPNDGEIEGRFKNAIEGMIAGPVMDALLLGLKAIKAPRDVLARGGSEAAAIKARAGVVESPVFREAAERVATMGEGSGEARPASSMSAEATNAPTAARAGEGTPNFSEAGGQSRADALRVQEQVNAQDAQPSSPLTQASQEDQANLARLVKAIDTGMIDVHGATGSTGMTVAEAIKSLKLDRVFFGQKYLDGAGAVASTEHDAAVVLAQAMKDAQAKGLVETPTPVTQAETFQKSLEEAKRMFNLDNRSAGALLNTLAEKQIDIRTYLTAGKFIEDLRAKTVAEKIREFNGHQMEVDRLRTAGDEAGAAAAEKAGVEAARQAIEAGLHIDRLAAANTRLASEVGRTLNILNMKPDQVRGKLREMSATFKAQLGSKRLDLMKPSELKAELERLNLVAEFGPDALKAYEESFKGAGRYARAAYESWMQSLLWGPRTWIANGSSLFQAVFRPLESSLGHLLTGNLEDAKHSLTLSWKWAAYLQESWRFAQQAFKNEQAVLTNRSFMDSPGSVGAINANFLNIDHPTAAGVVNAYGNAIRVPSRIMLFTDEFIKQAVARSYAEQSLLKQGLDRIKLGTLSEKQLDAYVRDSMQKMFFNNGRLYSEQAVRDGAIMEATNRGLKPTDAEFKRFVADYVEKNFDPNLGSVGAKAKNYAEEITWQKELTGEGGIERLGNWINSGKNTNRFLKVIFPFVRTPANLMIWVKDRSPFGIPSIYKDFASGDSLRRASAMGRLTSMAGFMTLAMGGVATGILTGRGPSDPEQRRQLMDTGWQPYSIKIGDNYVSYLRADPFSTLVGIVADLTDIQQNTYGELPMQKEWETAVSGVLGSLARSVTEKTFMAGLSLWVDAMSGDQRGASKLVRNYAGSAIPFSGLLNSVVPEFDDEMKQIRSITDAMMAKIPGLSKEVEPYRNIFGEALKKPIAYTGLIGGAIDPANPFPVTWSNNDPVKAELARLNYGFNAPTPTMRNGEIDLRSIRNSKGQSAFDRWQELHGQVKAGDKSLYQAMQQLIKSKVYQRMPLDGFNQQDSPRVDAIRSVLTRYRKRAQEQMLREFPGRSSSSAQRPERVPNESWPHPTVNRRNNGTQQDHLQLCLG